MTPAHRELESLYFSSCTVWGVFEPLSVGSPSPLPFAVADSRKSLSPHLMQQQQQLPSFTACKAASQPLSLVSRFLWWESGSSQLSLPDLSEAFWIVSRTSLCFSLRLRRQLTCLLPLLPGQGSAEHRLDREGPNHRLLSRSQAPGSVWIQHPLLPPWGLGASLRAPGKAPFPLLPPPFCTSGW